MQIEIERDELNASTVASLTLPRGGPDSTVLGCFRDAWYVLQDLGPRRRDFLGTFTLDGQGGWSGLEVGGDPDWGVAMCGVTDGELILMDPQTDSIKRANVRTGQVTTLTDLPLLEGVPQESIEHTCRFSRDRVLVSARTGEYDDPAYFWYDLKGHLVHKLTVDGLGAYLKDHEETVTDMGTMLTDPSAASGDRLPSQPGSGV